MWYARKAACLDSVLDHNAGIVSTTWLAHPAAATRLVRLKHLQHLSETYPMPMPGMVVPLLRGNEGSVGDMLVVEVRRIRGRTRGRVIGWAVAFIGFERRDSHSKMTDVVRGLMR